MLWRADLYIYIYLLYVYSIDTHINAIGLLTFFAGPGTDL